MFSIGLNAVIFWLFIKRFESKHNTIRQLSLWLFAIILEYDHYNIIENGKQNRRTEYLHITSLKREWEEYLSFSILISVLIRKHTLKTKSVFGIIYVWFSISLIISFPFDNIITQELLHGRASWNWVLVLRSCYFSSKKFLNFVCMVKWFLNFQKVL